jgi:hypothetical protein
MATPFRIKYTPLIALYPQCTIMARYAYRVDSRPAWQPHSSLMYLLMEICSVPTMKRLWAATRPRRNRCFESSKHHDGSSKGVHALMVYYPHRSMVINRVVDSSPSWLTKTTEGPSLYMGLSLCHCAVHVTAALSIDADRSLARQGMTSCRLGPRIACRLAGASHQTRHLAHTGTSHVRSREERGIPRLCHRCVENHIMCATFRPLV